MSRKIGGLIATLAVASVPATVVADADPGEGRDHKQAKAHEKAQPERPKGRGAQKHAKVRAEGPKAHGAHSVTWVLKGEVKSADAESGTLTVTVERSNRHRRAMRDMDVTLDVTRGRLKVRDVNHDGSRDLGDVAAGDRAHVVARLPRGTRFDAARAYRVKHVVVRHTASGAYEDPFAT